MIDQLVKELKGRNCYFKPILGTIRGGTVAGKHYKCYQVRGREEPWLMESLAALIPPTGDLHFIILSNFEYDVKDGICLHRREEDDGYVTYAILVSVMHCPAKMHAAQLETIDDLKKQKADLVARVRAQEINIDSLKKNLYEAETATIVARALAAIDNQELEECDETELVIFDHLDASQLGRSVRQLRRCRWRKLHVSAFCFAGSIAAFAPLAGLIVLCQLWSVLYLCWAHSDRKRRRYEESIATDQGITILTTRHVPTGDCNES